MFGVEDPAAERLGTIVHNLDLKDDRYDAPEAATLGALIDGLQASIADDAALLTQGMSLFESLYRSFSRTSRRLSPSRRRTSSRRSS
jgi:hypothetical protein